MRISAVFFFLVTLLATNTDDKEQQDLTKLADEVVKSLNEGKPVDESIAVNMLAQACKQNPKASEQLYDAQHLFMQAVWIPATIRALGERDAKLLETDIARIKAALKKENVPDEVASIGSLYVALYFDRMGEFGKSTTALTESGLVKSMSSPKVSPLFRGLYWNLRGLAADQESNFALALDFHNAALKLRRDTFPVEAAQSMNNLGLVSIHIGDFASARNQLKEAAALYDQLKLHNVLDKETLTVDEANTLLNLAKSIEGEGDFATSNQRFLDLLTLSEKLAIPKQRLEIQAKCRNNLAIGKYSLGEFNGCRELLEKSREQFTEAFDENCEYVAECKVNLGWIAVAEERTSDAKELFQSALEQFRSIDLEHDRVPEVMGYLARLLVESDAEQSDVAQSDVAQSKQLLEQALDLREKYVHQSLSSALSTRDRLALVQRMRVHPESISWPGVFDSYLDLGSKVDISVEDEYQRVLYWKGVLAKGRAGAVDDDTSAEAKELEKERTTIRQRLLVLSQLNDKNQEEVNEEMRLEFEMNNLERRLRTVRKTSVAEPKELRISELTDLLPADAVFVDIIQYRRFRNRVDGVPVRDDRQYVAYLVTRDGVEKHELGSANLIDSGVRDLQKKMTPDQNPFSSESEQIDDDFLYELREKTGDAKRLIISADGMLHRLPWCMLPGNSEKYLLQESTISVVASAHSLVDRLKRPARKDENWLVIGNVDYGKSADANDLWKPLPKTGIEAEKIGELIVKQHLSEPVQSRFLTGTRASKAELLRLLPQSRFVHVATHGRFAYRKTNEAFKIYDATSSLDSALVLAGANDDPTGGVDTLLTAEEVGNLRLQNVDLFVLSACETGLGHVQAGQGLIGLSGALDDAGVQTVIGSLWEVDDRATSTLMVYFYEQLLADPEQMRVADALRAAQLKLMQQPEFEHPYFWAAWTASGNPGGFETSK